jgi:hypothetical protein
MADQHHFKLKLPNGAEVDFAGDREFVAEVYRDTKAAALTLFNREASKTSKDAAMERLVGGTPLGEVLPGNAQPAPALPNLAGSAGVAPAASGRVPENKKNRSRPPHDDIKKDAKDARLKEIGKLLEAAHFDGEARYDAALKSCHGPLERAALITRLAQDKFQIDGLGPAEVRRILEKRFFIAQNKNDLEDAMRDAPGGFFVSRRASFDGRARLYVPMQGCIDQVNMLLAAQDDLFLKGEVAAPASGQK